MRNLKGFDRAMDALTTGESREEHPLLDLALQSIEPGQLAVLEQLAACSPYSIKLSRVGGAISQRSERTQFIK